jgi:hypothetical protein
MNPLMQHMLLESLSIETVDLETFRYDIPGYQTLVWNVTRAKAEIAAGQVLATVPIVPEEMAAIEAKNGFDPAHLDQVDHTQPGIGAPFWWKGQVQYLLIDGTHRCVKAHRAGAEFQVRLLTDRGARRCLLAGDKRLRV